MTEKQLDIFFKKASTVDEKADVIISYLQYKGLTPDQILDVINAVKCRLDRRYKAEIERSIEKTDSTERRHNPLTAAMQDSGIFKCQSKNYVNRKSKRGFS